MLQMLTSLLDLVGVLLFGVVGVLAASAAQGDGIPAPLQQPLALLGLDSLPISRLMALLAGSAAALLLAKSVITLYINRRVVSFLARCSTEVSATMCRAFFDLPITSVQQRPSQWSATALTRGVTGAIVNTLSSAMVIVSEGCLLVILALGLLVVDPVTTIAALVYFGLISAFLLRRLGVWAHRAGNVFAETDVESIMLVQDGIATYREITVADRRAFFTHRFYSLRRAGANAYADQQFIGVIPRYGMEVALVVGIALLMVVMLSTQPLQSAIGSLVLFMTAATRVTPSLLRLNGARLTLKGLLGLAQFAYDLQDLMDAGAAANTTSSPATAPIQPEPEMTAQAENLTVVYPGSDEPALRDVTFRLPAGASLALVGPSGAGKSTLADALLGVLRPTAGSVTIGGLPPTAVIHEYPGLIAYVPQDVALIRGSVRENVALGVDMSEIDDDRVWEALETASLAQFLRDSRDGLDTVIGERGVRLSGGQRQRLGIARALYSRPKLLVLDEATSALDAETEHIITETLDALSADVTTVTVAHRLATIRRADLILYIEGGHVLARGTFDEVRAAMPRFDRQANLLGL